MYIYGFLEETPGSVRVSDSERERASKRVSKSVSMQRVEQLNSVLNSPALRRGQLSPDLRQKEAQSVCLFIEFGSFLSLVLEVCPKGCNVAGCRRILDLCFKFGCSTSIHLLYRSVSLLFFSSPLVVFPAFMCCSDRVLGSR